ncbi:ABC transporter ATP-binding protein [Rhodobacteraceae bacterium RKSG542]|uniref:ABC transporter ATP-binding protein n=1 Tax=Pseudovibrio flavus TaxID=2529854 RepID=UPI0012BD005B|nr:ABC transporter ATP-binding protein [Pseudovibrio flavus]MTI17425.1 ABC transporter ATP-binding protein [Pseudovibrio flavus]
MYAIDVQSLTKRYGSKTVVDNVTLQIGKGQIVGFLGPNGSGKTTSIRMMCGLLKPDSGSGSVLGYDLLRQRLEIKNKVGYMTQKFSFYEDLSIEENLRFVARLHRLPSKSRPVETTLDKLGLTSRKKQLAGQLSGGWKQRLALAACTMHKPDLLLLDEPTAGVDPKARREFWEEIHEFAASGMTVLVSTHYMDEAERCHRIAYISYGKLLANGTLDEVITGSGLITFSITGENLAAIAKSLHGAEGVEQVAPFGNALHITGTDEKALRAALQPFESHTHLAITPQATSLEDVFIQFMANSQDNMQ